MNPWIVRLTMLIAGALFPLALAPFFWWPVGLVSLLLFVIGQSTVRTAKAAFGRAWWFGLGQFAVGVSWIYVSMHDHGGTPMFLAVPMVAVFAGFLALFPAVWFALRMRLFGQTLAGLTIPVFWFLQEWCRSWFMTGFPWLFAGDAHLDTWLAGWAPVIGSYGISFILVLTVSGLWFAARERKAVWLLPLIFWPGGYVLQQQEWTHATGELKVAAVQGNIPQDHKWTSAWVSPTISAYYMQTSEHWDADLVLWPETAMTLIYDQFQPYMDEIAAEASEHHTTVITGIPYRHPAGTPLAGEYHNSVVAFGNGEGLYHKQRLVPFGEYVPFEKQIRGLLPFFDLAMSSFLEGKPDQALLKVGRHREDGDELYLIAPFICYEIAYPDLVNRMARDADLLVTVSNDAWFGDSLGPKQHMALARMRALETGRWLLRSTNTGITALVDNKGQMISRLPYEVRATLTGTAQMRQGLTPYMQAGLWPLYGISILIMLTAIIRKRQQREWTKW